MIVCMSWTSGLKRGAMYFSLFGIRTGTMQAELDMMRLDALAALLIGEILPYTVEFMEWTTYHPSFTICTAGFELFMCIALLMHYNGSLTLWFYI
jgi:hypothetical protein